MHDMKCDQCGSPLKIVFRKCVVTDIDLGSLTEGQLADYYGRRTIG